MPGQDGALESDNTLPRGSCIPHFSRGVYVDVCVVQSRTVANDGDGTEKEHGFRHVRERCVSFAAAARVR